MYDDNYNGLPVARFEDHRLLNPEILNWTYSQDQTREEGRGLVWVDPANPMKTLDPEAFAVRYTWGEVRLSVARVNGQLGPMMMDPRKTGDRVWFRN